MIDSKLFHFYCDGVTAFYGLPVDLIALDSVLSYKQRNYTEFTLSPFKDPTLIFEHHINGSDFMETSILSYRTRLTSNEFICFNSEFVKQVHEYYTKIADKFNCSFGYTAIDFYENLKFNFMPTDPNGNLNYDQHNFQIMDFALTDWADGYEDEDDGSWIEPNEDEVYNIMTMNFEEEMSDFVSEMNSNIKTNFPVHSSYEEQVSYFREHANVNELCLS